MTHLTRSDAPPVMRTDAAEDNRGRRALADLGDGLRQWRLAYALARLDLRNRYRGSVLGPFWVTLSTAIMLAGLGLLYSRLFRLDLATYLPHLAVSLIVWNWMSAAIADGCVALTSAEGVIRQLRLPYTVHALRTVFRNGLTMVHSLPLIALVFLVLGHVPGPEALLAIPGLLLIAANMLAASLFLGLLCARFRDVGQIITNITQLAFFLTPVLWKPELLGPHAVWLPLNPFFSVLETVRGPLVEGGGALLPWVMAAVFTALHLALAFLFFRRFRARIAFWV